MMKLKLKAIFLTASIFMAVLLAIGALDFWVIQPAFKKLEQAQALEDSNRARAAITGELQQLSRTLGDWAVWDDAYAFADNHDADFIKANLDEWPVMEKNVHLNLCLILDRSSRVLYVGGYDTDLGGAVIPADFLGEKPLILSLLQPALEKGQILSGLLLTEHGLLLFAARPILTSEGSGPAKGVFAFGRFLDAPLLRELTQQTQVKFEVFREQDHHLSSEERALWRTLTPGTPQFGLVKDGFVYEALADVQGERGKISDSAARWPGRRP